MPEETKYRGVPIYFDGREWIVPPLSVKQFRDHIALLTTPIGEISSENTAKRMGEFVPVVGMALRRNYPDITDEYLFEALDLATFIQALVAVQKASGMKVPEPGEARPVPAQLVQ